MRLLRIAWLIAGTLLVARLSKSRLDWLLWHIVGDTLRVPSWKPFPFVPYLNAATLLAVSFAIVATWAWLIE
jgi:hypothetical protein